MKKLKGINIASYKKVRDVKHSTGNRVSNTIMTMFGVNRLIGLSLCKS